MSVSKKVRNDVLLIMAIGLFIAVTGALSSIEIASGVMISSEQAWEYGIAQTIVCFGVVLIVLGICYLKAFPFVKWALPLWLPIFFLAQQLVIGDKGKTTLNEFVVLGLPVLGIWLWSFYSIFKSPETIKHFQDRTKCSS